MDIREKLENYPREILISSGILLIMAVIQFVPDSIMLKLPYPGFFSALLSNTISAVTVMTAGFRYHDYILGVLLLTVVTSTFLYGKRSWPLHFLTTGVLAFYGVIFLALSIQYPGLATDSQILGLGVQVIFLGLAATETYKKVLNTDLFGQEVHRFGYAASLWQYVAGIGLLGAFQFLISYKSAETYVLGLFAVLGLAGVGMIYSAVELAFNSRQGFWLSLAFLSLLVLSSVATSSAVGAMVPFALMTVLWINRERYEVEKDPFARVFDLLP
ncbi:MAG: hypothetical protein ABEK04_00145 [Candidatus Nanohalobium sp.]